MGLVGRQARQGGAGSVDSAELFTQNSRSQSISSQPGSIDTPLYDANQIFGVSPGSTPFVTGGGADASAGLPNVPGYFSLNKNPSEGYAKSATQVSSLTSALSSPLATGHNASPRSESIQSMLNSFTLNDIVPHSRAHAKSLQKGGDDEQVFSAGSSVSSETGSNTTGLGFHLSTAHSSSSGRSSANPSSAAAASTLMPPPPILNTYGPSQTPQNMALFDPANNDAKKFVGTPDYLAPETITGTGQDEMSDWWSLGVIVFEFLYGYPPFHADTPAEVFENILARRIAWPEGDANDLPPVSEEALDLINRLICTDPEQRLGAKSSEEVREHPFFKEIDWDTILTDEASFIPRPIDDEDTAYFDDRGAGLQSFPEEEAEEKEKENPVSEAAISPIHHHFHFHKEKSGKSRNLFHGNGSAASADDSSSSSGPLGQQNDAGTDSEHSNHSIGLPADGTSLLGATGTSQSPAPIPPPLTPSRSTKTLPLHIPHHFRGRKTRRLSEPVAVDDFGSFSFKNLNVLEKANKDVIQRLKSEHLEQMKTPMPPAQPSGLIEPSPIKPGRNVSVSAQGQPTPFNHGSSSSGTGSSGIVRRPGSPSSSSSSNSSLYRNVSPSRNLVHSSIPSSPLTTSLPINAPDVAIDHAENDLTEHESGSKPLPRDRHPSTPSHMMLPRALSGGESGGSNPPSPLSSRHVSSGSMK